MKTEYGIAGIFVVYMNILVTGGAGFIGSHLTHTLLSGTNHTVVVLDALTYAGRLENLSACVDNQRFVFVHDNVINQASVQAAVETYNIEAIFHLAAETHVDRSINNASPFVETNVLGTLSVLEVTHRAQQKGKAVRMVHVSTDEVYGPLAADAKPFTEHDPLCPTSPYAASKASAEHLVSSYYKTYRVDVVTTRLCNVYGPHQHSEKFIPVMIHASLTGKTLPVYGNGLQKREWLHVTDAAQGIVAAFSKGRAGEVYNLGSGHEECNLDVVEHIVHQVGANKMQITHVQDRLAHDQRYALNSTKAYNELGWKPQLPFTEGLNETIQWYSSHITTTEAE